MNELKRYLLVKQRLVTGDEYITVIDTFTGAQSVIEHAPPPDDETDALRAKVAQLQSILRNRGT